MRNNERFIFPDISPRNFDLICLQFQLIATLRARSTQPLKKENRIIHIYDQR